MKLIAIFEENQSLIKFLILQHIPIEHPGIFLEFMQNDGFSWDTVELDAGDTLPDPEQYDAILVMGGPMDVWQEKTYPWLIAEKEFIRHVVQDLNKPFLGFCLGHQLLACALGGDIVKMSQAEVGILDINLTDAGKRSDLFNGIDSTFKSLQWHGAEVKSAPHGCDILSASPLCNIQALQYGKHAFGLQCHIELIETTVNEWAKVPEYAKSLTDTLGEKGKERLISDTNNYMTDFHGTAKRIYDNFLGIIHEIKS